MNCVPCLECGDGAGLTRENLDRWTDSIANVLASPEGRHHFKRYLESRSLDESLSALEFWERCSRVMPKKPDSPPPLAEDSSERFMLPSSSGVSSGSKSSCAPQHSKVSVNLHRDLECLVDYANRFVNFDLAQLRCLLQMLKMTDEDSVIKTLSEAKQSTMELLLDDYQLFREHLLESRGLLNK